MTKKNGTKRSLLMSAVALVLCFSMLVGSTFAWFTDSVTSSGNIIKSGKLDVEMSWADGDEDPATASYKDASTNAIFTNENWEPGYVEARHLKIANVGTLAFKYQMRILANGVVSELADVIDVYYFPVAEQIARTDLADGVKLGTLSNVLNNTFDSAVSKKVIGTVEAGKETIVTIAFKMQETAGNEYQNLAIGTDFSVQLLATQLEAETDSFDNTYDKDADFAPQDVPSAMVYQLSEQTAKNIDIVDTSKNSLGKGLDAAYSFQPTESYNQALSSEYSWAHADFFVYADEVVPANSMMLAGYYSLFGDFLNIDKNTWIGLTAGVDVLAGEANGVRLLRDGMGGISVAYNEICNYGNDGTGFLCGATDVTGENAGTTLTVELRLYKVACSTEGCHHNNMACETGEYITVGTFTYTFPGEKPIIYDAATMGGLYNVIANLQSGDTLVVPAGTYNTSGSFQVPAGVTIKGAKGAEVIFHQNSSAQDNIFNCAGDVVIENITFESNRKGYAVTDNTKNHDTDGNITITNCKFKGLAAEKNYGVYKNLNGSLTIENCTFDNYNNAICGVNNGNGSTTTITGCTFTNINGEAIGYVTSSVPADFEANVIANNTGLTAGNVIGY